MLSERESKNRLEKSKRESEEQYKELTIKSMPFFLEHANSQTELLWNIVVRRMQQVGVAHGINTTLLRG